MRYLTFGRTTGLRVSEIALGTSHFGGTGTSTGATPRPGGPLWARRSDGPDREEARKIFDRFAEAGGTFLDTADCYQYGRAEELLGEFVAADRDHFVLATKFTAGDRPDAGVSGTGNSRKNIIRSAEASLRRLGTDRIDLFWAHFPDALTPTEEILAALDHLVGAGKILYAGLSNFPAWRVARAVTLAETRAWSPIIGVQSEYNLVNRTAERETLPMAEALGLGVAAWSPLAGGLLSGGYRRTPEGWTSASGRRHPRHNTDRVETVVDAVRDIAAEAGVPPSHVAFAWLRARADRSATGVVPLVGPRADGQLAEYLRALDTTLTAEQVARLDGVSAEPPGTPHEITALVHDSLVGGSAERMATPRVPVA